MQLIPRSSLVEQVEDRDQRRVSVKCLSCCFNSHSSGDLGLTRSLLHFPFCAHSGKEPFGINHWHGVIPVTQPPVSKHWPKQGKSPIGLILPLSTTGLLRKGQCFLYTSSLTSYCLERVRVSFTGYWQLGNKLGKVGIWKWSGEMSWKMCSWLCAILL